MRSPIASVSGRIPAAVTPDLRPARERPVDGWWQRAVSGPSLERLGEPLVDLPQLRPTVERPASFDADLDQGTLREDDVGIPRGVAIALAIPDEHDQPSCGPVFEDPLALARPAYEAARVAVREVDRRTTVAEGRGRRGDRDPGRAESLQRRLDVEAKAVGDDLDRHARRPGAVHQRHEHRVVGLGQSEGHQRLRLPAEQLHLELHEAARADQPRVVERRLRLPLACHELGHDGVGDVGQRDRPVVVEQQGDRRVAGSKRRHFDRRGRHGAGTRRHGSRTSREPRVRRVITTPSTMITPPRTCAGRIGSWRTSVPSATAIGGTPYWRTVTRVGPRTFTPWRIAMFATPAAKKPEYSIASACGSWSPNGAEVAACHPASGSRAIIPPVTDQAVALSGLIRRTTFAPSD